MDATRWQKVFQKATIRDYKKDSTQLAIPKNAIVVIVEIMEKCVMGKEIWKDIIGYEGYYQVSDLGRVRSPDRKVVSFSRRWNVEFERTFKGRTLKPFNSPYPTVDLKDRRCELKKIQVHRLVAQSFLPSYTKSLQVNHKDGNKTNNNLGNLEMVTPSENSRHYLSQLKTGNRIKFCPDTVREVRKAKNTHPTELAKKYGVSITAIRSILKNKTWKYV